MSAAGVTNHRYIYGFRCRFDEALLDKIKVLVHFSPKVLINTFLECFFITADTC